MTGDMPIAHMELRELLDRLDDALRGGQPPSEVSRLANLIAVRTGQKVAKQSTAKAIAAACLRICRPQEYPSANDAARASGINARQCREWYAKLTAALSKEAGEDRTAARAEGPSGGSGDVRHGGGASSSGFGAALGTGATARCAHDEVAALDGLIDMARDPGGGEATTRSEPPPSAPPSPPEAPPIASDVKSHERRTFDV